MWTSVSSCCQSSSAGPSLRRPNDNLQYPLLLLRIHLLYSTGAATPPPPLPSRPLPSFLADPASRNPPCRPLYVHVHPLITSYPRATPLSVPNPLIIFTRRSDSPAPGGPIPFTFHYELAAIPAIEPAAFFSSCLCRGHYPRHLISVLPDRRRCLLSVTGRSLSVSFSPSISFSMFDPRCRCMCGPRRLPDGSGISEFPCAFWAPAVWSGLREED